METLIKTLKSRTNWVFVVIFAINGINAIIPMVTPEVQVYLNFILTALGIVYKMNPSQKY